MDKMRNLSIGRLIAGTLCQPVFAETVQRGEVEMTTAGTASEIVVKADNETAFDFLHKLDTHKFPNVFISPFSVNMALSVTANGARGTTLAEMQKALHLPITISQVDGILIWQPNRFQVPGL